MKKSYIKIVILQLLSLILFISIMLFDREININVILLSLSILFLVLLFLFGYEKNNHRYRKDIIINIIILMISYCLVIYVFGLRIGYIKNIFFTSIGTVLKNVIPISMLIILEELVRYEIVTKGNKNKFIMFLTVLIFVILDILVSLNQYDFSDLTNIILFIIATIIPSILRNISLSYIVYKVGYKATVIYQLFRQIPIYLLPFYPNLGIYLNTMIDIVFSFIIFSFTYFSTSKHKKNFIENNREKNVLSILILSLLICIICLNSGKFNYYGLVIMSNSMQPSISRGNIVIVEKINNKENPKIGDVLVFKNDINKIVVHRLIDANKNKYYYTKGDNNKIKDTYVVKRKDISGKVILSIPLIGYPTLWIKEAISGK